MTTRGGRNCEFDRFVALRPIETRAARDSGTQISLARDEPARVRAHTVEANHAMPLGLRFTVVALTYIVNDTSKLLA